MHKINFEERAVAFIDVLGFGSIVDQANQNPKHLKELEELIDLLNSAVFSLNGLVDNHISKELIPKHIYISDSIILSAPLTSKKMANYNGLSILVMRVIQITHMLLNKGYLIRGGISIGNVWHTESNIVGVAYQEAYKIETRTSVPRVELSDSAIKYWYETEGDSNKMCLKHDDHFMVNGLHDYYIPDKTHGAAERAFAHYAQITEQNIINANSDCIRLKWQWYKSYIDSEINRNEFIMFT